MANEAKTQGSQTLARGLRALEIIGDSPTPMTVARLAEAIGIHRSMAYRLLATLEAHGFAARTASGEIELGARLVALARGVARDLQAAAAPELDRVADELQLTTFLVTHDGEAAVTLLSAQPRDLDAMVVQRPGSRHSVDVGAPGRVIRSQLDPVAFPPARFELSHEEVIDGLNSIAVPIALPQGRPAALAALFVARPIDQEAIVERLVTAARHIAERVR
ncbi:IclR family transcriptional regulator [Gulosibacter sp. ACHW.36C]|uniref:Helix-turn-helix domain-containing protein n=1 Tax=Gulosibacter sediminis TaxID=1729695 RepID=A0ABY4MWJ7_9MICO|nr:helix-turn-helix domain-containing protein [Gulosibacter sediminis]UQN14792.1 helix-turn-helix domain-containing protein [Gulosibacter sediminis]